MSMHRRVAAVATTLLLGGPLLAFAPAQAADDVTLNLIGINDFHGRIDAKTVKFAGTVEKVRQDGGEGNSLLISAGDNVSASLFASATQGDIPTIDVLNALALDASAAGNHEFDKGADDLTGRLSDRADFPFLAANIFKKSDGQPLLDKYKIFTVDGVSVAVVGAITQETASLVSPAGIGNLTFTDPTDAINDTVAELKKLPAPPKVIVASVHEGAPDGTQSYAQNVEHSAVFKKIAEQTSPDVDAIFMGHTHQAYTYDAPIPGVAGKTRPIIQTGSYGANVGNVKLTVDAATGDVESYTQANIAQVTTDDATLVTTYPRVAKVKPIVDDALAYAATVGNKPIGEVTADVTTAYTGTSRDDRASESTLGNLVADALLSKVKDTTAGADIGVVNPGGLRAELLYAGDTSGNPANTDGVITYAEANAVLPFVNQLNTVTLKGSSLKKVLEEQWQLDDNGAVPTRPYLHLGLSKNVSYTYDASRAQGSRITSVLVNGQPLDLAKSYKVATFSFLATGGDNFRSFKEGTTVDTGLVDYEAWIDYLTDNSPISPSFARRSVAVTGVKDVYRTGGTVSYTLSKLDLTSLGSPANTSVSSKLLYDGKTLNLGSKTVRAGTSAPITFTLPAGVSGAMTVESTAYPSGTKVTVPLDVTGATVSATAATGTYGDDVDVPVTVTGPEGTPTGTVTIKDGDTVLDEATLAGGSATLTIDTAKIGAGAKTLTVVYGGDSSYPASTGTAAVTVAKAGTSVRAQDPEPTAVNADADVDVTVSSDAETQPTGTVTISEDGTALGTATLAEGAATVDTDVSGLSIGSHTLSVAYSGDANHEPSTTSVDISVFKGTAELDASTSSTAYGTAARIDVQGDPGASGLVYVGRGDAVVGVGFLRNGVAQLTLGGTALKPGSYALDVYYGGSETFEPSQTTVALTVTTASTRTAKYSVSPSKVVVKKIKPYVTFSVKASGFTVDSGTFTVRYGSHSVRTKVVNGKARVRLPRYTSTGKRTIKGYFAGNSLAKPSQGSLTIKVVKK